MKANTVQQPEYKQSAIKQTIGLVKWQDLRQLTCAQIIYNLVLPYPFLLLSWWFASHSWYVLACSASDRTASIAKKSGSYGLYR